MRPAAALAAVALLVLPGVAQGSWQARPGDWAQFRHDAQHLGSTAAPGAFDASLADLRVKWTRHEDPGFWVPPVAADIDGDGVAEVVGTIGNASADPGNVAAPLRLESGVEVVDGGTGQLRWKVGPTTGNLAFYSPALGDVDGDGKAEVVWFDGNPVTGNSATNKLYAYKADGTKLWEWSDASWPATKVPLPLTGVAIGDVDGEAAHDEAVLQLLLAHVDLSVEGGTKVVLSMSQPEERLIAVNGEGTPGISWQRQFPNASISSPALADLDRDGKLDVLYGSGVKPGPLVDGSSFAINLSSDFADDHVRAFRGGATGQPLWSVETGRSPGEDFAPLMVDVDRDGVPDAILHLWDRHVPETGAENTFIVALSGVDGHELWRTRLNASVYSPPAAADVDGDGKPEILVQTGRGVAPDQRVVVALRGDGSVLWRSAAQARGFTSAVAAGDLLGTGRPVVVAIEDAPAGRGDQLLLLDGRTGQEVLRKDLGTRVASVGGPILADLDGTDDGRAELLVNIGEWGQPGDLVAYEPELPDLRVTNLAFNATTHAVGQAETLRATVQNVGSRPARGVVVRATDEGAAFGERRLDLAPGASADLSLAWVPGEGGTRTVRVSADPDKLIPEWNERNNDASAAVFVHAPDLTFASGDPVLSDSNPGVGDNVTVNVTLRNVGGLDAHAAVVRFLDDGSAFAERTADVPAGGSVPLSAVLRVQGERNHELRVVADPDNLIGEESETNNAAQALLRVRFLAPDLAVGAVRLADPNPDELQQVNLTAEVRNQGSPGRDARGVEVQVLDGGVPVANGTVPLVPAGGSAQAVMPVALAGVGPHNLTVVLDPRNLITELDETNNAASLGVVVGKLNVTVRMGSATYGLQEPARGVAHVQFLGSGKPLRFHELSIPVEYVLRPVDPADPALPQALAAVAALTAKARAATDQALSVCVAGQCVNATADQALDLARALGAGAQAGLGGAELTFRVATIAARTDARGDAAFDVPQDLPGMLDGARGAGMVALCLDAPLAGSPACAQVAEPLPSLPAVGDLPGTYRATASVDWWGYGFAGRAAYQHTAG